MLGAIIILLLCEIEGRTSFGLTCGGLIHATKTQSKSSVVFGTLMEGSMGGSFSVRGSARISGYAKRPASFTTLSDVGWCIRNITFILGSKYTKKIIDTPVGFYIGAGPGIHLYNWEDEEHSDGDTWVGWHIFTGLEYGQPNWPFCLFGEAEWGKELGKKEGFPGFGDPTQWVFGGGIRF